MTREEATIMLIHTKEFLMGDKICWSKYDCHIEALDMAIEALSDDFVKVVRCKDCRHRDLFSCPLADNDFQKDDDYCSWGERREE